MHAFLLIFYFIAGLALAPQYKAFSEFGRLCYAFIFPWCLPLACYWDSWVRNCKKAHHYAGYILTFTLCISTVSLVITLTFFGKEGEIGERFGMSLVAAFGLISLGGILLEKLGLFKG